MRKGQRASSSSESEKGQRPWLTDSEEQSSPSGCSSGEDSSSDSDTEAESAMKRSQRFSRSFSFGEDQQLQPERNEDGEEEPSPENSKGEPVTEQVTTESAAEFVRLEKRDNFSDTNVTQRSGLFRPQRLWLAMTRCLSLRWPPCLSINRQTNRKLAYQLDLDQSEDTQLSSTSESSNQSSSSTSTSDDREVTSVKHHEEEVGSRVVKSAPPPRRGVSRSSPRLPRARQVTDSVLASLILEKEMFLKIELVDSGKERDDLRYRAEWKLSERTKELAEGVWLSRSQKNKYDGLTSYGSG
ncbi:uncharacterized protein LOC117770614 [Hippoglossus hippoglossus]|uniref:uncharacterized protein LOC117770614 n=1 Tax=Hippoglossus hippoglossus TaxID=8267 RepID=UPI00148E46EE|nr:uncharacterized protein LOC117770614 [Hippoglossus hippoglossus]